jgi:hypothetical protein
MSSLAPRARVIKEPVNETIRRLETFVSRMERRYECASDVMAGDVKSGRARDTAEVSRWLADYHVLCELRRPPADGRATGSTSMTTRMSTRGTWKSSTVKGSSKTTT